MNDLPSSVREKKLLLISDACAAAGFTFFLPCTRFSGFRATKDRPEALPSPFTFYVSVFRVDHVALGLGINSV